MNENRSVVLVEVIAFEDLRRTHSLPEQNAGRDGQLAELFFEQLRQRFPGSRELAVTGIHDDDRAPVLIDHRP